MIRGDFLISPFGARNYGKPSPSALRSSRLWFGRPLAGRRPGERADVNGSVRCGVVLGLGNRCQVSGSFGSLSQGPAIPLSRFDHPIKQRVILKRSAKSLPPRSLPPALLLHNCFEEADLSFQSLNSLFKRCCCHSNRIVSRVNDRVKATPCSSAPRVIHHDRCCRLLRSPCVHSKVYARDSSPCESACRSRAARAVFFASGNFWPVIST